MEVIPALSPDWRKAIDLGSIGLELAKYATPVDNEGRKILAEIISQQEKMSDFGTYQAYGECIRGSC